MDRIEIVDACECKLERMIRSYGEKGKLQEANNILKKYEVQYKDKMYEINECLYRRCNINEEIVIVLREKDRLSSVRLTKEMINDASLNFNFKLFRRLDDVKSLNEFSDEAISKVERKREFDKLIGKIVLSHKFGIGKIIKKDSSGYCDEYGWVDFQRYIVSTELGPVSGWVSSDTSDFYKVYEGLVK